VSDWEIASCNCEEILTGNLVALQLFEAREVKNVSINIQVRPPTATIDSPARPTPDSRACQRACSGPPA